MRGRSSPPTFSPDGQWIYFTSNKEGDSKIWRVPAGGGEPERVTQRGYGFRFSSDGKMLYFVVQSNLASNLWAKFMADGREYPITDLAGRTGRLWWKHRHGRRISLLRLAGAARRHLGDGRSFSPRRYEINPYFRITFRTALAVSATSFSASFGFVVWLTPDHTSLPSLVS